MDTDNTGAGLTLFQVRLLKTLCAGEHAKIVATLHHDNHRLDAYRRQRLIIERDVYVDTMAALDDLIARDLAATIVAATTQEVTP